MSFVNCDAGLKLMKYSVESDWNMPGFKYMDDGIWKPEVKIKYHAKAHKVETHGAWYDLAVPEDIEMKAGDFKIIPFNISMKMPPGYEGHIVPRSSTFKNWGILQANSFGR